MKVQILPWNYGQNKTNSVQRALGPMFVPAPRHRIGNKNIMNRRNSQFKIKKLLPQTKQAEV